MSTHEAQGIPTGDERELLMSRAIDGRASASDWNRLEAIGAREPGLWRDLALAQRDQRQLEVFVARATQLADAVELPEAPRPLSFQQRLRTFSVWGGWAVAAVVALAVLGPSLNPGGNSNQNGNTAGIVPVDLSNFRGEELLSKALERGREDGTVPGELADGYLIRANPLGTGQGYEVVYVRPIVVKRRVNNLLHFPSVDEAGNPLPQPVPLGPAFTSVPRRAL